MTIKEVKNKKGLLFMFKPDSETAEDEKVDYYLIEEMENIVYLPLKMFKDKIKNNLYCLVTEDMVDDDTNLYEVLKDLHNENKNKSMTYMFCKTVIKDRKQEMLDFVDKAFEAFGIEY